MGAGERREGTNNNSKDNKKGNNTYLLTRQNKWAKEKVKWKKDGKLGERLSRDMDEPIAAAMFG
jgi:hypothetical protein